MKHALPALESYAGSISKSHLMAFKTYLNALFFFITQRYSKAICLTDLDQKFVHDHANFLSQSGSTYNSRLGFHSCGNQFFKSLYNRYCTDYKNLSNNSKALRYPALRAGNAQPLVRDVPVELETHIREYCLQVLQRIDSNPFRNIVPEKGIDVFDASHVLHDLMMFQKCIFSGTATGSYATQPAKSYPWRTQPTTNGTTRLHKTLGRKAGEFWCGGMLKDMTEALFPTPEEIVASVLLVTLDIGWIDTAKAFTFGGHWYTTFAKNPLEPTTKEYVALTPQIRPKTSREVWSKASHTRVGGSWWVLKRIQRRSDRLRHIFRELAEVSKSELDGVDRTDRDWDNFRIKHKRWCELTSQAFIFRSMSGAGSATSLDGDEYTRFLRRIPERSTSDIPVALRSKFTKITHYDLRHLVAERTFRDTGLLATQQVLGHASSRTTLSYLRSRKMKDELFEVFARITGIAFDEISNRIILNRAVIQQRFVRNGAQLTVDERRALGAMTIAGARCKDPANPPNGVGSISEDRCIGGSCVRCPLAVWNWHDTFAIPLAVAEYAKLKKSQIPTVGLAEELEISAWEILLQTIPDKLESRLNAELLNAGLQIEGGRT